MPRPSPPTSIKPPETRDDKISQLRQRIEIVQQLLDMMKQLQKQNDQLPCPNHDDTLDIRMRLLEGVKQRFTDQLNGLLDEQRNEIMQNLIQQVGGAVGNQPQIGPPGGGFRPIDPDSPEGQRFGRKYPGTRPTK
jgi:hypothetical protein